jgi:hypothetical protein
MWIEPESLPDLKKLIDLKLKIEKQLKRNPESQFLTEQHKIVTNRINELW